MQKIDGGMFDIEILYIARELGYRMIEVPVEWYDCPGSTINVMKCVIFDPFDVAKIKINGWLGKYKKRNQL